MTGFPEPESKIEKTIRRSKQSQSSRRRKPHGGGWPVALQYAATLPRFRRETTRRKDGVWRWARRTRRDRRASPAIEGTSQRDNTHDTICCSYKLVTLFLSDMLCIATYTGVMHSFHKGDRSGENEREMGSDTKRSLAGLASSSMLGGQLPRRVRCRPSERPNRPLGCWLPLLDLKERPRQGH